MGPSKLWGPGLSAPPLLAPLPMHHQPMALQDTSIPKSTKCYNRESCNPALAHVLGEKRWVLEVLHRLPQLNGVTYQDAYPLLRVGITLQWRRKLQNIAGAQARLNYR